MNYLLLGIAVVFLGGCNAQLQLPVNASGQLTTGVCLKGQSATPFAEGTGTVADPFIICTPTQFAAIAANENYFGAHYSLASDLDFSTFAGTLTSIGNYDGTTGTAFTGFFEGNNHVIANLTISNTAGDATGIFAYTHGATIQNLNVRAESVTGNNRTGGLVGFAIGTVFKNLTLSGSVTDSMNAYNGTGGVIGGIEDRAATDATVIQNVTSQVNVVGFDSVGGIVGSVSMTSGSSLSLLNSQSSGSVSALPGAQGSTYGGMVAILNVFSNSSLTISHCSSTSNVTTNGAFSGGFIGTLQVYSGSTGKIDHSFYNGNFISYATYGWFCGGFNGGFIGTIGMDTADLTITDSYAKGTVSQLASSCSGGLLGGFSGIITAASSGTLQILRSSAVVTLAVSVNGANNLGGFAGQMVTSGTAALVVSNAYAVSTANLQDGNNNIGGFLGATGGAPTIDHAYVSSVLNVGSGSSNVGAVAGYWGGAISSSYYNSSPLATAFGNNAGSGAPSPQSAANLKLQSTFSGWDFASVWTIANGVGSPTLR